MTDQLTALLRKSRVDESTSSEEDRLVSAYERMQEITRKVKPYVKPFRLVRVPVARKWLPEIPPPVQQRKSRRP